MVNKVAFFLIFAFTMTATLFSEDIKVVSEIDQGTVYANETLKGTISITHDKKNSVDIHSFLLGKNQLAVELVKEVQMVPNDPLVLSIYSFNLAGQPEGLYALPAVSVKIGGKVYQSTMSSYHVEARKGNTAPAATAPSASPVPQSPPSVNQQQSPTPIVTNQSSQSSPLLRLEAGVDGSNNIYPGQRTKLVYHYYFSGDIALTTETLPLLDAEGMVKIGEKEIQDSVQGTTSVREISQQVEALKPGKFSFGPSLIEGYAYKEEVQGHPVYTSDKLSSQAPPVVITVMPFPEKNKPASFNGAVGNYTFKTSLLSGNEMTVGDELSLSLEISGKGNLKAVSAPDLCCQPGYSGFFKLSDLPPSEEIDGDTKKIVVKLRPLNAQIKAIPSIEFSFFNPETAQYVILHSEPIAITVKPSNQGNDEINHQELPAALNPKATEAITSPSSATRPIEIESIFSLSTSDLYNKVFGSWWALAIIPLGIAFLIYQSHLKEYLEWQKNQVHILTSQELFAKAFAEEKQGKCNFDALKTSFKMALAEAGLIPSADITDEELPTIGLCGEVKVFWAALDEKRFAGAKEAYDIGEIHQLSQNLMNKIYLASKQKSQGVLA